MRRVLFRSPLVLTRLSLVVWYGGVAPGARGAEEEGSWTSRIGPRTTSLRGEQTTGRARGGEEEVKAAAGALTRPPRRWAIVAGEGGVPTMGESTPAGAAGGPGW